MAEGLTETDKDIPVILVFWYVADISVILTNTDTNTWLRPDNKTDSDTDT